MALMRQPLFSQSRPAAPPQESKKRCLIFQWIGQSMESCDRCGHPVWCHLYHPPYGGNRPIFYARQWTAWSEQWNWEPVGSLINHDQWRDKHDQWRDKA